MDGDAQSAPVSISPSESFPRRASIGIARRYKAASSAAVTAPIVFTTGQGSWLFDLEGNRYLDFIGGYGVVNTGWQHPRLVESVRRQAAESCFAPPWFPNPTALKLAERLRGLAGVPPDAKCLRAAGGADANEQVLKAVATHAHSEGRPLPIKVLCLERSYHGGTAATLALSDTRRFSLPQLGGPAQPAVPPPFCSECPWGRTYGHCALECVRTVDQALESDASIAAVIVEPILASGGVIIPPHEYLPELRTICDRRNVFLIFDEVLTGCGRTGSMLAAARQGVTPDAVTLGKGLSAGAVPIGAAVVSRPLWQAAQSTEDCSSTFAWTPLACAAASTNLDIIEQERLCERATERGSRLAEGLGQAADRRLPGRFAPVRSVGLMAAIEPVSGSNGSSAAAKLIRRLILLCKRHGLIAGTSWDWRTLVLLPPLTLSSDELEDGLLRFEAALADAASHT